MLEDRSEFFRRAGWVALLTLATILGSFVFACATPFAALAAIGALFLPRRDAFFLLGINWLANQAIGYCFLHYPQTWDSFAWGAAIGIAALAATAVGCGAESLARRFGLATTIVAAFVSSFVAYEFCLFAATAVLPADGGFAASVILYVCEVNGLAFAGLLFLQGLGRTVGLASNRGVGVPSPA